VLKVTRRSRGVRALTVQLEGKLLGPCVAAVRDACGGAAAGPAGCSWT
jgi:hypothetical protein